MKKASKPNAINAMQDLTDTSHGITKHAAALMVKKFKSFRNKIMRAKAVLPFYFPVLPLSICYNKKAIADLMAQDGCCGIRIYPAINKNSELTLVIVGIDATGENIFVSVSPLNNSKAVNSSVVDEGQMSPPYPAPKNGF